MPALVPTPTPDSAPALSVVLVNTDRTNTVRRTLQHLRAQTICDRLEVLVVAESLVDLDIQPEEEHGFWGVQWIERVPLGWVDRAQAPGIRRAQASVVALVEDHAFPAPDWAERLVAAHAGPWSVVGSAVANANPDTALSWANLLIGYGTCGWVDPVTCGEVDMLPNHNVSYKRDVLLGLDDLEGSLERGSSLHDDLRAAGHRFYQSDARIYHVNPSRLRSVLALRFAAGRLYGAQRAASENWSLWRRLGYVGGAPLIPLLRLRRFKQTQIDGEARHALWPRVLPAALAGFLADAAGQALGYLAGAGEALQQLADFEVDRLRHVTENDRRAASAAPLRSSSPSVPTESDRSPVASP